MIIKTNTLAELASDGLTEDINPPAKSNKDNIEVFIDASKSSSRQEAITTDKDNTKMKKKKLSYKQ